MSETTATPEQSRPDSRPDWVVCIQQTHAEKKGDAWCGRPIAGFAFENIDHAAYSAASRGRQVPCPQCVKAIMDALNSNQAE